MTECLLWIVVVVVFWSGNSGPGYLYDKFFHFFDSVVYPTISLRTFIKNGYLTDEQKNAKDALNVAHLGVWISLFVACISPFCSGFCWE